MSKMSEMAATIADLRKCAAAIGEAADWLVDQFSDSEPVTTMPEQTEPTLTLEEVRAALADKSRAGFTAQIRSLLQKYGSDKLSGIDPVNYKGLLADLDTLLPEDWDTTDIYRRQEYIRDTDDPTRLVGTVRRMQVSHIEIWCECFGRPRDSIKKSDSYEIEAILRSLGNWEKYTDNKTGKRRIPIYGLQRVYLRTE